MIKFGNKKNKILIIFKLELNFFIEIKLFKLAKRILFFDDNEDSHA